MTDIKTKDIIVFLLKYSIDLCLIKQHRSNTIMLKKMLKEASPTTSNKTQYNSGDPLFIVISIKPFMKTSQNLPNQTSFFQPNGSANINSALLLILAISPKF